MPSFCSQVDHRVEQVGERQADHERQEDRAEHPQQQDGRNEQPGPDHHLIS